MILSFDDLKAAWETTAAMNRTMKRENELFIKALRYYATTDMRDIALLDNGQKARAALKI